MIGRSLVALGFAGCIGLVLPAVAQEASPQAANPTLLRVEQASIDLGTIRSGSEATAVFVFHNDGKEPVKIIRAKPS